VSELSLPERIVAIDRSLTTARIPHAFGGALALAYYAEPRVTVDIDLNVFVTTEEFGKVAKGLGALGVDTQVDESALRRDGQCRLRWDQTPVDLFFAYDAFHEAMRRQARLVPFGEGKLRILSPEHLLVCKAAFDRAKDWLDIEQMLVAVESLDLEEIRHWLDRFVGKGDPREQRFEQLVVKLRDAGDNDRDE
jgi:hypothetical protein